MVHLFIFIFLYVVGMNMDIELSESSPEKFLSTWLSFIVLRNAPDHIKLKFREVEKVALKIGNQSSHLSFNETRLDIYIYNIHAV